MSIDHIFEHTWAFDRLLEGERRDLRQATADAAARARSADADAGAMRRVAAELQRAMRPVRTALDPLFSNHVATTWAGRAADASRHRLEHRADRIHQALRGIDQLATELRRTADRREADAEDHWADHARHAHQAHGVDGLLGAHPSEPAC